MQFLAFTIPCCYSHLCLCKYCSFCWGCCHSHPLPNSCSSLKPLLMITVFSQGLWLPPPTSAIELSAVLCSTTSPHLRVRQWYTQYFMLKLPLTHLVLEVVHSLGLSFMSHSPLFPDAWASAQWISVQEMNYAAFILKETSHQMTGRNTSLLSWSEKFWTTVSSWEHRLLYRTLTTTYFVDSSASCEYYSVYLWCSHWRHYYNVEQYRGWSSCVILETLVGGHWSTETYMGQ